MCVVCVCVCAYICCVGMWYRSKGQRGGGEQAFCTGSVTRGGEGWCYQAGLGYIAPRKSSYGWLDDGILEETSAVC